MIVGSDIFEQNDKSINSKFKQRFSNSSIDASVITLEPRISSCRN
jgi:hypothetical protein